MIYENNEEKRNTLWRTVLTVSSVIIIIILIFFIVKLFTGNPLEGSWVSEDSGAVLEIGDDGTVTLTGGTDGEEEEAAHGPLKGMLSNTVPFQILRISDDI